LKTLIRKAPILLAIGIATVALMFACRKEQNSQEKETSKELTEIKQALTESKIAKQLSQRFNDTLTMIFIPDWNKAVSQKESDSTLVQVFPLNAHLKENKTGKEFIVHEEGYVKYLVVSQHDRHYSFSIATTVSSVQGSPSLDAKTNLTNDNRHTDLTQVLFQDENNQAAIVPFDKNGWVTRGDAGTRISSASTTAGTLDEPICVFVCNWGYYCMTQGYTATVSVSIGGCFPPPPPPPCPKTGYFFDESPVQYQPVWNPGPSDVSCSTHPPGWQPPAPDPSIFKDPTGGYSSASYPMNITPIPEIKSSYWYICPGNFTFVSVTTNDLWQEAAISNIYCTTMNSLGYSKTVTIPILYFGVPYYNVSGKLRYTRQEAQNMATDCLNYGEWRMRRYFKNFPAATAAELSEEWIKEANNWMTKVSKGSGKIARKGSLNPAQPVTARAYIGCVEPPK